MEVVFFSNQKTRKKTTNVLKHTKKCSKKRQQHIIHDFVTATLQK